MPNPAYAYIQLGERDELLAIRRLIADALTGADVEWQTPETYHITLAYTEDIDDSALEDAIIDSFEAFSVRVSGLSLFNNPENRALVLVVDHSETLDAWQKEVEWHFAQMGVVMSKDTNPERWQPHITIGYLPEGVDMPQVAFEPFTLGVDAIEYSRDDYQVVRTLMANDIDQPLETKATTAIKAINDTGRVGGYAVVWGSAKQRDLTGEYFTPDTNFELGWYDRRPMLYHHGLDGTLKTANIGIIDTLKEDDTGLWAEAQLDMRSKYVAAVRQLIDKGVLGWSSGSLAHLRKVEADGRIVRWPLIEASATPTPAEPRHTDISAIKSAYQELGLDLAPLELSEPSEASAPAIQPDGIPDAKEPQAIEQPAQPDETPSNEPSEQEDKDMDTQAVVSAVLDAVLQQLGATLSDEDKANLMQSVMAALQPQDNMDATASAEVAKQVAPAVMKAVTDLVAARQQLTAAVNGSAQTTVKGLFAGMQPVGGNGNGASVPNGRTPAIQVTRANKYSNLDAQDMAYMYTFMKKAERAGNEPYEPGEDFWRALADKSVKSHTAGKLALDEKAVKAINYLADQGNAFKANELDHSTQSTFGDEWVPDLWAAQIWEAVRMDNVVASQVNVIDMPSDPFELPTEGADPTVYLVPETTAETELLLATSASVIPDSKIGTGKVQLDTKKLALRVGFSNELVEDSIIPVVAQFRKQAQRAMEDSVDNVLLNGDTDATINTNINLIDGTPGATAKYLATNGFLKQALITTTANAVSGSGAAITLSLIRQIRFLLSRQYTTPASNLRIFVDPEGYGKVLGIPEVLTMAEYGNEATNRQGDIRVIDGMQVLPTAQLALANSAGKIPAAGGTLGRLAVVHVPSWYLGYRRRITLNVEFLSYYDAYVMTATMRIAVNSFDSDNVGLAYNLLV